MNIHFDDGDVVVPLDFFYRNFVIPRKKTRDMISDISKMPRDINVVLSDDVLEYARLIGWSRSEAFRMLYVVLLPVLGEASKYGRIIINKNFSWDGHKHILNHREIFDEIEGNIRIEYTELLLHTFQYYSTYGSSEMIIKRFHFLLSILRAMEANITIMRVFMIIFIKLHGYKYRIAYGELFVGSEDELRQIEIIAVPLGHQFKQYFPAIFANYIFYTDEEHQLKVLTERKILHTNSHCVDKNRFFYCHLSRLSILYKPNRLYTDEIKEKMDDSFALCCIIRNCILPEYIIPRDTRLSVIYACDLDKVDVLRQMMTHLQMSGNNVMIYIMNILKGSCRDMSAHIFMTILDFMVPTLTNFIYVHKKMIKCHNNECLLYIHRNFPNDFFLMKKKYNSEYRENPDKCYKSPLHKASGRGDDMSYLLRKVCAD